MMEAEVVPVGGLEGIRTIMTKRISFYQHLLPKSRIAFRHIANP